MVETVIFYSLATLLLVFGLGVITRRNPLGSALALIGAFVCLAALYGLLAAPLVAVLQILVYAGGIMVLMVFVIMLLNLHEDELKPLRARAGWVSLCVLGSLVAIGLPLAWRYKPLMGVPGPSVEAGFGGIHHLAALMFGPFLLPFEALSVLLLAALAGALVLAKRRL
jgi:NADH-quinone oxidoreductase subunit J